MEILIVGFIIMAIICAPILFVAVFLWRRMLQPGGILGKRTPPSPPPGTPYTGP